MKGPQHKSLDFNLERIEATPKGHCAPDSPLPHTFCNHSHLERVNVNSPHSQW